MALNDGGNFESNVGAPISVNLEEVKVLNEKPPPKVKFRIAVISQMWRMLY